MDKVKPIIITIKDTDEKYTLEFSRASVKQTVCEGFHRDELENSPEEMIPILFYGSFLMHHPRMTKQKAIGILDNILHGLDTAWLDRLVELYNAPLNATVSSKDEEEVKNLGAVVEL